MYVYIHTYMHALMHACMCACMHTYTCIELIFFILAFSFLFLALHCLKIHLNSALDQLFLLAFSVNGTKSRLCRVRFQIKLFSPVAHLGMAQNP